MEDMNASEAPHYLTFRMGEEECAVPVSRVREILEYDTPTRVPSTPAWIRGVINLRGGVVPVVDLAAKFALPESPITKRTCIVIVEVGLDGQPALTGILADTVNQVVQIGAGDLEELPAFGTGIRVECLMGMARLGNQFALVLDVARALGTDEFVLPRPFDGSTAETAVRP